MSFFREVKDFLTGHNIPFADYNVWSDESKKNEMVEKSGQMRVLVIFVDEEMILGFDK